MIVADSNLIASCVLESAATDAARQLREEDGEWYVPVLWRSEVMNILSTMIRSRGLSAQTANELFKSLRVALRAYERDPASEDVFELVARFGITGYDAQFVALAQELNCPLYTQDKELLRKFPTVARPFYTRRA